MKELIALPLLSVVLVIQMAIASRIPLLSGHADLMLVAVAAWSLQERAQTAWHWAIFAGLLVGWVSGVPWGIPVLGYLFTVIFARALVRRIWQTPLLGMFVVVFISTLVMHLLTIIALRLTGSLLVIGDALSVVTLPSLFINLSLALFAFPILRDLAVWVYDIEDDDV